MVTIIAEINEYIRKNTKGFNRERLEILKKITLDDLLMSKNPYLFHLQNILLTQDFTKYLLDAYLSSQEETIFGNFLEGLAIFINEKVYAGWKSSSQGIDLEFNKDNTRYIVAIKSGPNWGNSSQIRKMRDDFNKAKKTIRTGSQSLNVVAINGCCYGRNNKPDKGEYFKYCGQKFWEFISGNIDLYLKLIKSLGYLAKEKNEEFSEEYAQIINKFTQEFSKKFVINGKIDWNALVQFNSSKNKSLK